MARRKFMRHGPAEGLNTAFRSLLDWVKEGPPMMRDVGFSRDVGAGVERWRVELLEGLKSWEASAEFFALAATKALENYRKAHQ